MHVVRFRQKKHFDWRYPVKFLTMGTSQVSYLSFPQRLHIEGCPTALISVVRSEDQGEKRDLWGAMSKDMLEQPSQKSFKDRHAPFLFISYLIEHIDWLHFSEYHWSFISEGRQITDKIQVLIFDLFSDSFLLNYMFIVGLNNKKDHKQLSYFMRKTFLFMIRYFPQNLWVFIQLKSETELESLCLNKKA